MDIEKLEPEEITPEWVKENLCMDDGSDITDCHELIAFNLSNWEDLEYEKIEDILTLFHLKIK